MPPTRSHIRATTEGYLARYPEEREALAGLLSVLDGAANPSSRATLPGHVTCSAAVIDRHRRVLHIGHKVTGLLLAPGGHVEDDRTLLAAALREVCEETGIRPGDLCLPPQFLGAPIDIDVHAIDANPAKGEGAHRHFDFRFAFYLATEEPLPLALQDEEVSGAQWLPLADVRSPTLRAKLLDAEALGLDGLPEPVNASALVHDGHGRILLGLRHPVSKFAPNTWHFLARHCEREAAITCLVREAKEEVGLIIEPDDVELVHTVHHVDSPGARPRIGLVFRAHSWAGTPEVLEPDRCVEWRWWKPQDLPAEVVPYTRRAIEGILGGRPYSEMGWGER
ncbi:NUDIX domain-containing protein [Streptomyces hirsutus]|uniref:NUDIX domain-containing protein n=1 Tax=Streptomyces hirsutus TaxID=35620 RepID=UPI0036B77A13